MKPAGPGGIENLPALPWPGKAMSYQAIIHHLRTGRFLMECRVEGHDLREAENAAIAKAALKARALPCDIDVRRLHQCAERRDQNAMHDLIA
jgi:hypothetical protein